MRWRLYVRYLANIALALDEFANTWAGGDPRETVSSRAAKARAKGRRWAILLCRFLDLFQKGHCQKAERDDVGNEGVLPD